MNDKELGNPLDRRSFLKSATGAAALVATGTALPQQQTSSSPVSQSGPTGTGQRIPVISPKDYTPEQHQLYKTLDASIQKYLQGFVSSRSDGALIGPFNILLRFPQLGTAIWNLFTVLAESTALPSLAREVVILATGAHYSCLYELYSHEAVALRKGLSESKIETIAAGQRPNDLTREEALAYDVASILNRGALIPQSTYNAAVKTFGEQGMAEMVTTIGCYTTICVLLNAFDVSLPGTELGIASGS